MPIHSERNLYPGVNAHLNSYLQAEPGGWKSFHAEHIVDLARVINEHLPPGYFTRSEMSLQIEAVADDPDQPRLTIPDVTIYHGTRIGRTPSAPSAIAVPDLQVPLVETLEDEETLTGLVIYQVVQGGTPGRPLTRIELLSPSNKLRGSHYEQYLVKRASTLRSGLTLVEIDYLHETRPITQRIPSYPDRMPGAAPYAVLVSSPKPNFEQGKTDIYLRGVDQALPTIKVLLAGDDSVAIDLGEAYRRTFEQSLFYPMVVDYAAEPMNSDRYHAEDQTRIHALLETIHREASAG